MTEEIFDVVDKQDRVIGQAPRAEVHAKGLLHRAVNIFVFNSKGELLLQKRSATKDEFPGCYTSSASGHLDAGETYEAAASRELMEELGLSASLEYVTTFPATAETANEHSALYLTTTDETPCFHPEEIESGKYFDLQNLAKLIESDPEQFASPFRVLFGWYMENHGDQTDHDCC